ncbi:hypothetical protein ACFOPQ_09490 [Deinococcus antarcticus]|uniref:Uncharacterized protein n=1 Tax=Deinococcus antarcticus TaxID=1298767 RepID=A0ABV8A5L9_9DEIO
MNGWEGELDPADCAYTSGPPGAGIRAYGDTATAQQLPGLCGLSSILGVTTN